jgi:hypothetical protein
MEVALQAWCVFHAHDSDCDILKKKKDSDCDDMLKDKRMYR